MGKVDILFIGGHHSSAVPLIKLFLKDNLKIAFLGHKYASKLNSEISSEYKEISALNIPYTHLSAPKFYNVSGILKYFQLIKSILFCVWFLLNCRPKLVFSFGGYLSVPITIAAKLLFIKVYTHEQTASPGLATNVVSKFSDKIFLTWESKSFKNKSYVVGIPLRKEILDIKVKNYSGYKIKTIYVQGGKQGSRLLNEFIFKNIEELTKTYNIIHQTGKHSEFSDYKMGQDLSKKYNNYKAYDFIFGKDYTNVLNKADLTVTRSGAHMVYEASFIKMPCIFVPISWASNNEQQKNAERAAEFIPSSIIKDSLLSLDTFNKSLLRIQSEIKQNKKYKAVKSNSAELIYDIVNKSIKFY
jgi:UDP-N-acetylglucosamine--N-acetylmuramyl-(pentapeptide) pyrophosphoryl-undecaprenol N-acetylglucosamine transferase